MSIRTIKLPYRCFHEDEHKQIRKYIENYNCILRFTYNRLKDSDFKISQHDLNLLQKSMNNISLDSWFLTSAFYDAKGYEGRESVIFGGKQNFLLRCQEKISKEEFNLRRLQPIYSVGEANLKGNRKFQIIDEETILFKVDKKHHYHLRLSKVRENYRKDILKLIELQNDRKISITYKLDLNCVYISFEDSLLNKYEVKEKIPDRIFAIDLNPNYIGWSVVDWLNSSSYRLIDSGVVSIKKLNDIEKKSRTASNSTEKTYLNNKKKFENIDSVIRLVRIANHYQCQIFALEDLEIETKDSGKGRKFNRLVNNQWSRNIFYQQIQKYCDRYQIKLQKVQAAFSSFLGNLVYRETDLPDMCLSSIEIGRRSYEFYHQYTLKDKPREKNIIFDNSEKAREKIIQSLEELNYFEAFEDLKELYIKLKTLDMKYRVPLENSILNAVFSKKSIKSQVLLYST